MSNMRSLLVILFIYFISGAIGDDECTTEKDCLVESSACVNKTCVCPPDFVYNSERTKCLEVSHGYDSACVDSIQCSTSLQAGGICINGTCKCTEGYHYFKGQCWRTVGLGESCVKNYNCFVSNDFEASICNNGKVCECALGYYQREYSSCRRISKKPGDPCGIALDCKFENATCTRNRTCQIQSSKDEENSEGVQLKINNIQEPNRKKRNWKFVFTAAGNFGSSKIGTKCQKDSDCPQYSRCYKESVCLCFNGYYTLDNSTCLPELGGNCTTDKDCPGKNTFCRNGTYCTCKQGFVASYNSRYCDKMSRNIEWSCLRDDQCGFFGPGGKCISKKCHCSNETHWVSDQLYCWVTKRVGEPCIQEQDCGGENSSMTCAENKNCSCTAGTHASSNGEKCNKDINKVGGPCDENIDCLYDHAVCNITSHRCTCQSGFLENNTICIPGINGSCKSNEDCSVKNSHCVNNTCICNADSVPSMKLDKCLDFATNIGVECSESVQCSQLAGDCISGQCLCQNGSAFIHDIKKCYVTRAIGERCTSNRNCTIRHAVCQNSFCVCKRGYRARGNACYSGGNAVLPVDIMLLVSTIVLFLYGFMSNV